MRWLSATILILASKELKQHLKITNIIFKQLKYNIKKIK
jgi:hypothetical protein